MDQTMYEHIYTVDLNQPMKRHDVGLLATYDKKANRFGAKLTRDGAAVDVSGCAVYGYFIRPNEHTVLFNGAVSEGIVYVDLPENCYYYDGAFTLSVKIKNGDMEQTVLLCDGRISQTRTDATIDEENVLPPAAPDGYGLGEYAKKLDSTTDIDTVKLFGIYAWGENKPTNAPDAYMHMVPVFRNEQNGAQYFQKHTLNGAYEMVCKRVMASGKWGELEWINPPMKLGEEYRTTERWEGKPVYTMLVNCGDMVSGSSVTYAQNVKTVRYAGFAGGVPLPYLGSAGFDGAWSVWMQVKDGAISVYGGSGYANTTITTKAQVWYTKN